MFLQSVSLQNFRSWEKKEITFHKNTTAIIGPNTVGKTNIIEAIYLLSSGRSFRAEKDVQAIQFGKELARVKGLVEHKELEAVITSGSVAGSRAQHKKYMVNLVPRRRSDFIGHLLCVLFSPGDLEIVTESPSFRRSFLDEVLEQVDGDYRRALLDFIKALKHRNSLLQVVKETGRRDDKSFEYWDSLLIKHGSILTQKREELIGFFNTSKKDIFDFAMYYDKSVVSKERLEQYKDAEVSSGVTLVGPHRDDFSVHMYDNEQVNTHNVRFFGSRGQQRLSVVQLKLLQILYIEERTGERPLFLLDDVFSELDDEHIQLILEEIPKQQTILTTTHREFIPTKLLKDMDVIELK